MTTKNMFSKKEVKYLKSQRIARISTVSPKDLQPDVSPVGFDCDGEYFYVGGINLSKTRKYKNVLKNNKVALVIDDLETVNPWTPRAVRIYGIAEIVLAREDTWIELIPRLLLLLLLLLISG
jgi:pyridoxamine 5'-phosphate oxidase family protein